MKKKVRYLAKIYSLEQTEINKDHLEPVVRTLTTEEIYSIKR